MNELLRQKLCDIVTAYGPAVADDPGRCGELLRQAAPEDGVGVEALLRALVVRVPARLALLTEPLAMAPLTSGLVRRLIDEQGLSEEAARWAVESWAVALGKGGDAGSGYPGQFPAYEHILTAPRRRWRFLWYMVPALAILAALGGWWWSNQRAEVRRITGRTGGIYFLSLDADTRTLLAICGDGDLRLWDVNAGTELQRFDAHLKNVHGVALSPDGRLALWCAGSLKNDSGKIVAEECAIRARNLETGKDFDEPFDKADVPFYCVAFSPDGRLALAGLGDYDHKESEGTAKEKKPVPKDCVIRLYDVATGKVLRELKGHKDPVWRAVFTPDSKRVVSAGLDASLRLWDVESGSELKHVDLPGKANIICLAVSPDGQRLLTGDNQSRLTLWDLNELEPVRELKRSAQAVGAVAFSTDGHLALSGGDDYIVRLWDADTLTELRHFPGHTTLIFGVAFLADGRHALSGSADGTIRIWKLP
jgi:WD40 repeat protein